MCDYSLHAFPNRLARQGEDLVVHRFGGTSLGLASPADLHPLIHACQKEAPKKAWSWTAIKEWFLGTGQLESKVPAVCMPPGARLILWDIPKSLQREFGVGPAEEVKFVEISAEANTYRDAIQFQNGCQVLLQALREGQRVSVLSLESAESEEPLRTPRQAIRV